MIFAAWCKKELGNPHSLSYSTVPGAHVADVVTSGLFHVVFTKCDIFLEVFVDHVLLWSVPFASNQFKCAICTRPLDRGQHSLAFR